MVLVMKYKDMAVTFTEVLKTTIEGTKVLYWETPYPALTQTVEISTNCQRVTLLSDTGESLYSMEYKEGPNE